MKNPFFSMSVTTVICGWLAGCFSGLVIGSFDETKGYWILIPVILLYILFFYFMRRDERDAMAR